MKKTILGMTIVFSLGACASVDDKNLKPQVRDQVRDDSEYVTGSHLPRRKNAPPSEVNTLSSQQVEDLQRNRTGPKPMGGGF